jgi:hypothetical protein
VQEHDTTRLEVKLGPTPPPPPAPVAKPEVESREPAPVVPESGGAPRERTVAIVAAVGAVGLAAAGFGAYLVAGMKHTDSVQACAQVVSHQPDACDDQKNAVRAWDWAGVGAWAAAAAASTVAVVSLVRLHRDASHAMSRDGLRASRADASPSARVVVGPASLGVEGTF